MNTTPPQQNHHKIMTTTTTKKSNHPQPTTTHHTTTHKKKTTPHTRVLCSNQGPTRATKPGPKRSRRQRHHPSLLFALPLRVWHQVARPAGQPGRFGNGVFQFLHRVSVTVVHLATRTVRVNANDRSTVGESRNNTGAKMNRKQYTCQVQAPLNCLNKQQSR